MPLSSKPVTYVSLYHLLDQTFDREAVEKLLPIESKAKIRPKMKMRTTKTASDKAVGGSGERKAGMNENGSISAAPSQGQMPIPAESVQHGEVVNQLTDSGKSIFEIGHEGDGSSPVGFLSPVGTWKSRNLSPRPTVDALDEIQPQVG